MNSFGFVIATKMLVDQEKKVRYMYHEQPLNPQDSGWRFFCGDEDDNYVNNPENLAIYDIKTILSIDNSIQPYLDSAIGYAFEREDETKPFVLSEPFTHDDGSDE